MPDYDPDPLCQDAVVIGGGFYGAAIAVYLAGQRGLKRVVLVEQESELMTRASYNNQARVHNGYHYPRSFTTAYRSRVNLPKFVRDWPLAIKQDFTKLYAIARRNSKVTARQFERFCRDIGAGIQPADPGLKALFEPRLIEGVSGRGVRIRHGATVELGCTRIAGQWRADPLSDPRHLDS